MLSLLSLNKHIGEEEGKSSGAVVADPTGRRRCAEETNHQFLKTNSLFKHPFPL